jgi:hypothetical protein
MATFNAVVLMGMNPEARSKKSIYDEMTEDEIKERMGL